MPRAMLAARSEIAQGHEALSEGASRGTDVDRFGAARPVRLRSPLGAGEHSS
jgi:hypothetical protein